MKIKISNSNLVFNKLVNLVEESCRLDNNTTIYEMSDYNNFVWTKFYQGVDMVTITKNDGYFKCSFVNLLGGNNKAIRMKLKDEYKLSNATIMFNIWTEDPSTKVYYSLLSGVTERFSINTTPQKIILKNIDLTNCERFQIGVFVDTEGSFNIQNFSISA